MNLYNEIDRFAATWLRELITAGHIAPGVVDERSIEDITPDELKQYTQCHFFAGIGTWSYALRCAGWPDDRPCWTGSCPCWTGSCPCQPYSTAGEKHGVTDERHLWPAQFHLIEAVKPPTFFGEQVEAAIKYGWIDLVQDDMEGLGYTFESTPFPACSLGASHVRKRLYFVGHSSGSGLPRPVQDTRLFSTEKASQSQRSDSVLRAWRELDASPSSIPHLDGAPLWLARMFLHGYGNALVAPQAIAYIESFLEHEQAIIEGQGTS